MNSVEKIKALLDSPAVESVCVYSGDPSRAFSDGDYFEYQDLENFKNDDVYIQHIHSFEVNFHEWPEIGEGDLVMTSNGEGIVESTSNNYRYCYRIILDGAVLAYQRHEIALLAKTETLEADNVE